LLFLLLLLLPPPPPPSLFKWNRKVNTFFMVLGLSFQNNWRCILIQMRGILNFNFLSNGHWLRMLYIWLFEIVLISFYENDRISNKPRLNEVELERLSITVT
jgi:hypothetical protein